MQLRNEFVVPVPIGEAWAILTDLQGVAECMPGAVLDDVEDGVYTGRLDIKVGPVTSQYRGRASFTERDDNRHVAVLRAEGRDTRGQGNASAEVTAALHPDPGGTLVTVVTNLTISGRVAQFGRGLVADVSRKLLDQFATRLNARIAAGTPTAAPEETASTVDLVAVAGIPVAKRLVPIVFALAAIAVVVWRRPAR